MFLFTGGQDLACEKQVEDWCDNIPKDVVTVALACLLHQNYNPGPARTTLKAEVAGVMENIIANICPVPDSAAPQLLLLPTIVAKLWSSIDPTVKDSLRGKPF